MNLTGFQTLIQNLVKTATGFDDAHVIWQKQTRARPSRPFVGLDILEDATTLFTEDTVEDNPEPTAPTQARLDLAAALPDYFSAPSHVIATVPGPAGNAITFQIGFNPSPGIDISYNPGNGLFTVLIEEGVTTSDELIGEVNGYDPDVLTIEGIGSPLPMAQGYGSPLEGGAWGLDEILLISKEHVELNVQVVVYSSDVVGSNNAANLARKIRAFFSRESTTTALGNVALVERAPVRDATIVLETEHEGRGVLGLKFRVADLEQEATTYIETATVETTIENPPGEPVVNTLAITVEE